MSRDTVDYSQRTADDPEESLAWTMKILKQVIPYHPAWTDPVAEKRLRDLLADSQAGVDTSPQEDALLRQARPRPGPDDENKPFDQNAFFGDIAEMRKSIPKKL